MSANVATGSTYIPLGAAQTVGVSFKPGVVAPGTTTVSIATYTLPGGSAAAPFQLQAGTVVSGDCVPTGDTVSAVYGGSIVLATATTAGCTTLATDVWKFAQSSPGFGAIPKPGNVSGQTTLTTYYTLGLESVLAGTGLTGDGLSGSTTVQSGACTASTDTCVLSGLSPALSATAGTYQLASVAASWSVFLEDTTGVYQGMRVTGTNVQAATYVDYVNRSTGEVRLSQITAGLIPGGATLTFTWDSLASLGAGMTVLSAGTPAGDTIASVGANAVTLSAATTGLLSAATPNIAAAPVVEGSLVTFYRPYSDSEAAALQMDQIGINAAVQAAASTRAPAATGVQAQACGQRVDLSSGRYEIDAPIVLPLYYQYAYASGTACGANLFGAGRDTTFLEAVADFGIELPLVSSGDPAAHVTNGRGVYASSGLQLSTGRLDGVTLEPSYSTIAVAEKKGTRPKWNGAPVSMMGVRQGSRRMMRDDRVQNFNVGIWWGNDDHTVWEQVQSLGNFVGLRVAPANGSLFGDDHWKDVDFYGNDWANVSVAATGYLDGSFVGETHLAYAPYAVWCEDGAGAGQCVAQLAITGKPNLEQNGCNIMRDGNETPSYYGSGATRGVTSLTLDNAFASRDITYMLAGGCNWNFFDLFSADNLEIRNIGGTAWQAPSFAGQSTGSLLQLQRVGASNGYAGAGTGNVLLHGDGLTLLWSEYAGLGQQLVSGLAGTGGPFFTTGSYKRVAFQVPGQGLQARLFPILTAARSMPMG